MKTVNTVCARDCYDSCFLKASVDAHGRLVSVKGDGDHPVTRGFVCLRGNKDAERVYENRVLYPHVRSIPKPGRYFQRTDWDDALGRVAEKIEAVMQKWGPEKILLLRYSGNMGLLTGSFSQRLWNSLGAVQTDGALCSSSGHAALELHFGSSHGLQPEELPSKRLIVFWGGNPVVSSPHSWALAAEARRKINARIVVIDSRRSESAAKADLWLAPRPETDVALANGIARQMIRNNRHDAEFIRRWTTGFDAYTHEVEKWTLEKTAGVTGIKPQQIREFAEAYGGLKPSAMVIGVGFQRSDSGAEAVRAVSLLSALTGQHRGFFYGNSSGYMVDKALLAGGRTSKGSPKVVSQVSLGSRLARGEFKLVFIQGMNPALTLPDHNAVRRGLTREDTFVVLHDPHWTASADLADVVLPAQTHFEKEDINMPWCHWYVQKSNRAIEPLAQSRGEVDVMTALAERLELADPDVFEDPWSALAQSFDGALAEGSFKTLMDGEPAQLRCKAPDLYPTPSGKIEFAAATPLPPPIQPLPEFNPPLLESGEYILLNSAVPQYTHTQFQDIFGPIPSVVWINPLDANKLGISEGENVELFNSLGKTVVQAKITDDVPPGVLWVPKQFPGEGGTQPQNALCPGRPQTLGGGSTFNSTVVRVRRMVGAI
jgi:anaerobic selenocysteine-containing dehydrogenase